MSTYLPRVIRTYLSDMHPYLLISSIDLAIDEVAINVNPTMCQRHIAEMKIAGLSIAGLSIAGLGLDTLQCCI
ncbi:hypothetical protein GJ496_005650 [Pomphorhynchus laevis]|nr:hypothetical protein GJ496_005650 [Pomphorhynchus laevis]